MDTEGVACRSGCGISLLFSTYPEARRTDLDCSTARKSPVQTPHEFLALIRNRPLQAKVTEFTKHYENARFGDSPTDAQRLPVLYEEIRRFRKEEFRRGQS